MEEEGFARRVMAAIGGERERDFLLVEREIFQLQRGAENPRNVSVLLDLGQNQNDMQFTRTK